MTLSLIAIGLSITSLVVSTIVVSASRRDARNCARDTRSAAKSARAAAESVAQVDTTGAQIRIESMRIPAGAMPPTFPIPIDRAARQRMREMHSPQTSLATAREKTTPGAGADNPAPGVVTKP